MLSFVILALITVAGVLAALSLRNLVHCALALTLAFAGLAMLYLQLDAQFVGFAQVLVYIGAVAILIVFAILLTRGAEAPQKSIFSSNWAAGIAIAAIVFAILARMILTSRALVRDLPAMNGATVRQIGDQLMTK